MAQLEEGWPLGLQPFNVRVALGRASDYSGSISFNTLVSGSPTSSTDSSTVSTGSFFPDKSITLGSLMGASSIYGFSKGSTKGRKPEAMKERKSNRSGVWFFSLCSRDTTDARSVCMKVGPSLGHLLAVERRAAAMNTEEMVMTLKSIDRKAPWPRKVMQKPTPYLLMAELLPVKTSAGRSS